MEVVDGNNFREGNKARLCEELAPVEETQGTAPEVEEGAQAVSRKRARKRVEEEEVDIFSDMLTQAISARISPG